MIQILFKKKYKIITNIISVTAVILTSFVLTDTVLAQMSKDVKCIEEITEHQPLAVGSVFYAKSTPRAGYQAYYTYMGLEGDNRTYNDTKLIIKYQLFYHYDELEEEEIFKAPVSSDGSALFSPKLLHDENIKDATKLRISIADNYGQIRVKEEK